MDASDGLDVPKICRNSEGSPHAPAKSNSQHLIRPFILHMLRQSLVSALDSGDLLLLQRIQKLRHILDRTLVNWIQQLRHVDFIPQLCKSISKGSMPPTLNAEDVLKHNEGFCSRASLVNLKAFTELDSLSLELVLHLQGRPRARRTACMWLVGIIATHVSINIINHPSFTLSYSSQKSAPKHTTQDGIICLVSSCRQYFQYQTMRRGFSPSRTRALDDIDYRREIEDPQRQIKPLGGSYKNFCHYNNAVYMGGMSSSQKHGKGLLLHDDGASVITEYHYDSPSGHNIIFRQNSITSILYNNQSQYVLAFKSGKHIIKIPFNDNTHRSNGSGFLIDYQSLKLYELHFENGVAVEKILHLDRKNNEDVFKRNAITKVIGVKHQQAFDLTFQKPQNMHVKYDRNQLTVGYYNANGELHGLGFRAHAENAEVSGVKSLSIRPIERGYYRNGNLETFGQRFFSNGNKYVGQFEVGEYNGQGILLCPQQMKWVYGQFIDGKLSQVIDSNNERHTRNDYEAWVDSLWHIHKRYAERWIDMNIQLPDELYLERILSDVLGMRVTSVDPDHQEGQKEDKYSLDKIQHQFIQGFPGDSKRSYVDQELEHHYNNRRVNGMREYSPKSKERSIKRGETGYPDRDYRQEPFKVAGKISRPEDYQYQLKRYNTNSPYTNNYPHRSRYRGKSHNYYDEEPLDGVYRRTYFDSLERQKERLKKLQDQDKYYLRNLREQLGNSPVHRKYKAPTRYSPDPYDRNYDLTESYVRRVPPTPTQKPSSPRYYEPQQPQIPPRPSRNVPYRKPATSPSNRSYIQNNYKYWK